MTSRGAQMPTISMQFHAEPNELMPLLVEGLAQATLLVALRDSPFSISEIHDEVEAARALQDSSVSEVIMLTGRPDIQGVTSDDDLLRRHPGSLLLEIGRVRPQGLRESWLACKDASVADHARWRKVGNALRRITIAGCQARDPVSGATSQMRNHRHTAGARSLAAKGVPILPAAGAARLEFVPIAKS